jgi:sec-independent protein translocase protein TatB
MLRAMFGMGGTEILVILIVALLFLGPDKLPEAAKTISKGIRDIKKQSRVLQRTIEDDEHIGGAIRDLRSALRGEDEPVRPKPRKQLDAAPTPDPVAESAGDPAVAALAGDGAVPDAGDAAVAAAAAGVAGPAVGAESADESVADTSFEGGHSASNGLTLPRTAGEPEGGPHGGAAGESDAAELAGLVKPAPNTIARGAGSSDREPEHG